MKMHGLGNDFVIIDSRHQKAIMTARLVRAIGDRHRGVGFDQLAEIRAGVDSDISLDFWNADGSVAGACGNATRCVADFVMAETGARNLTIRTMRGVLQACREKDGAVSVNMGLPQLDWADIPVSHDLEILHLPLDGGPVAVGMGNPHCVFFVADVSVVDVAARGAVIERDPLFPEQTNVEFAEIRGNDEIRMRVWERGVGITLACGSGACATAVAAHMRGLTGSKMRMELDGGWMGLEVRDDGVWMTAPTALVFHATLDAAFLETI